MKDILNFLTEHKCIAVLIDPEKVNTSSQIENLCQRVNSAQVDFIFVGGSTVDATDFNATITLLKENTSIPIVIFPGSSDQVSELADGILYLTLLSGRNPDFLIGHHVQSAQRVANSGLEVIPTAYLLIEGGTQSSVAYVSQTTPIPRTSSSIVYNTALAGKLQGKQVVFMDAGSGAKYPVPLEIVQQVSKVNLPIIVGGGIKSSDEIKAYHDAGVNCVVVGNKIEEDIDFLLDIKNYISTLK